jgi:hypothetical protein
LFHADALPAAAAELLNGGLKVLDGDASDHGDPLERGRGGGGGREGGKEGGRDSDHDIKSTCGKVLGTPFL